MTEPVNTATMTRLEWLAARRLGIGGSDVGAILGLNKWRSPFEVWMDKTGKVELNDEEESEYIHWGNILEEVVAQEFARVTGKKVRKSNKLYRHETYPFLTANIDRMIVGEDAILECKTTSHFNRYAWEDDEIPASYLLQVQHYLNVLNKDKAYIAVLIGGNHFVWKEVRRDQELIDLVQAKLVQFWEDNVLNDVAPAIDGSKAATDFIKEQYSRDNDDAVTELGSEQINLIADLESQKEIFKALKEDIEAKENQLKVYLGETGATFGVSSKYSVSWKPQTRTSVDAKLLKAEYPEIYEKVAKQSSYKVLRIKGE